MDDKTSVSGEEKRMELAPGGLRRLILDQMNRAGSFLHYVGIEITEVGDSTAEGTVSALCVHANPMGSVHGGVLFSLMDAVGGAAGASTGRGCATVDASVHFLRAAAPGDSLRCRAECAKSGRHLMIVKTCVTNQDGVELACGTFTYQRTKEVICYPS